MHQEVKPVKHLLTLIVLCFWVIIPARAQDTKLNIVTTTTFIADVARSVGGDLVNVISLVPPDTDIHAFQPSPQDVALIAEADVVLSNGAGLESFLGGLVENVAVVELFDISNGIPVLAFGGHGHDEDEDPDDPHEAAYIGVLGEDAVCDADHEQHEEEEEEEAHDDDDHHGDCDPHFWTNPQNVMIWARNIAEIFAFTDRAYADTYRANAEAYVEQLEALDAEIEALLAGIPEENRVIVTNHEFLAYFAARYDFEIVGNVLPGLSTLAEPAPQDVAELITTIQEEGVRAIFVEISDTGRLAQAIAGDLPDVQVVTLYSDSLSSADGPAATYLDYMRYNAGLIAAALGG